MKRSNKLDILFEDKNVIIVNKPAKLLTIATASEKENTLFHQVVMYLHKKNQKAFIVHRLDKDTSGLIIFAKTILVKEMLQSNWVNVKRKYYALVEGVITEPGTIASYLAETKTNLTYVTKDENKGKLAVTSYTPIQNNGKYTLLDVEIKTGRKNQIRVQLSSFNHPIVGDKKYGSKSKSRLMLQAYYLELVHPLTGRLIKIVLDNELIKI